MKAVVLEAYGPAEGLVLTQVEAPEPGPGELLVRVQHTTVTMGDTELRRSNMPWLFRLPLRLWLGVRRPRRGLVLGMEVAGTVQAVGEGVVGFAEGDAVYGVTPMGLGGYAELARVSVVEGVARAPSGVPLDQLAALPIGGLEAMGYLRRGGIAAGQRVLVRGASGSIGGYALQLAKHHFGAHVTGVCGPEAVERVAELGADEVLDYTERDFWQVGQTWDLMLDVVGKMPISRCLRVVTPGGAYVRATVPGLGEVLRAGWARLLGRRRVVVGSGGGTPADLVRLGELIEQGVIRTVIDRRVPLEDIAEAHRYVQLGHKQGNVIVDVS